MLLTVHPADCLVRDFFAQAAAPDGCSRATARRQRAPTSPADLMLRMVNHMVDSYLELRRLLTRQLTTLQRALLDPHNQFDDWPLLLESRDLLHRLGTSARTSEAACRNGSTPWATGPTTATPKPSVSVSCCACAPAMCWSMWARADPCAATGVVGRVGGADAFLGARAPHEQHHAHADGADAIFMPLNLITGFFGMNFDALPLIHSARGFWIAAGIMLMLVAACRLLPAQALPQRSVIRAARRGRQVKRREDLALACLHARRLVIGLMVVALRVQGAMHQHVGVVGCNVDAGLARLALDHSAQMTRSACTTGSWA